MSFPLQSNYLWFFRLSSSKYFCFKIKAGDKEDFMKLPKREYIAVFLLLTSYLALISASAYAFVEVSSEIKYYYVKGKSLKAVNKSLKRNTPKKHLIAAVGTEQTDWNAFYVEYARGQCEMDHLQFNYYMTYLYPEWTDYDDAKPELQAKWDHYIERIEAHEETHVRYQEEMGDELYEELAWFKAPCRTFKDRAQKKAKEIITKYEKLHRELDKKDWGNIHLE
jgi:predicted secreted Zn-dependent protease